MKHLNALSHGNENFILDMPFTIKEINTALQKLKRGKSPGPQADNLVEKHLVEDGEAVAKWLMKI